MSLAYWADNTLLWDTLILGGEVWPGVPTIETTLGRAVDEQRVKGSDGAFLVDQGYDPAKIKITIRMWLEEQWREYQRLLPSVHPRTKGGVRSPVQIAHPEPNSKGVTQIYITGIGPLLIDRGLGTATLDAIEWFPAPKPAKTSTKSKVPKDGGQIPSPQDVLPPNADASAVLII